MDKIMKKLSEAELNPNIDLNKIYVLSDNNEYIYECSIENKSENGKDSYITWALYLVAGKNYADDNDIDMSYVTPDAFTENVQYESFNQYFIVESFEQAAKANGFKIVDSNKVKNITIKQANV